MRGSARRGPTRLPSAVPTPRRHHDRRHHTTVDTTRPCTRPSTPRLQTSRRLGTTTRMHTSRGTTSRDTTSVDTPAVETPHDQTLQLRDALRRARHTCGLLATIPAQRRCAPGRGVDTVSRRLCAHRLPATLLAAVSRQQAYRRTTVPRVSNVRPCARGRSHAAETPRNTMLRAAETPKDRLHAAEIPGLQPPPALA